MSALVEWEVCPRCTLYRHSREGVIRAHIAQTSSGQEAEERWREFMTRVHAEHWARQVLGRFAALMAVVNEPDPSVTAPALPEDAV